MNKEKFAILKEKQDEIKKLKKEMLDASNKIFTDLSKSIFEEHPKVESFSWTHYTNVLLIRAIGHGNHVC